MKTEKNIDTVDNDVVATVKYASWFSFGRSSRTEWWFRVVLNIWLPFVVVSLVLYGGDDTFSTSKISYVEIFQAAALGIVLFPLIFETFCVTIRRFHDVNLSHKGKLFTILAYLIFVFSLCGVVSHYIDEDTASSTNAVEEVATVAEPAAPVAESKEVVEAAKPAAEVAVENSEKSKKSPSVFYVLLFASIAYIVAILGFVPGSVGANKYGDDPIIRE